MSYIDGYLTPVRVDRKEAYRTFSATTAAIYKEYGALRVVDCWQDAEPQDASMFHAEAARDALHDGNNEPAPDFRTAAGARSDEVVVFSWMEWPDKATRDTGLEKILADPRIQPKEGEDTIFEGRRLIAGGFTVILDV
ncbi:MAG: hypothetical protein JWP99_471 [Devosia sp.]|nr:hypothetical protein [Devosia sp.]